ncbi:gamma-glutamyltransferase family protein [Pelagibacteraceae bacterium]|jgi:gamma-glutamyltranspeptidase / glutathione hydrolase|nr:gamma-glutamyltransferase family protein [Pelagibacteraceae bacterium]
MRKIYQPGRSNVLSNNAMVATSQPLSSQEAINILKLGGNAVDAAIAASAVLSVVEPGSTGIGGDCFAIIKMSNRKGISVNGSGINPAKANLEYFKENKINSIGLLSPHSVTIPGAVDAWYEMHKKFGKLEFEKLFATAIYYAREGFPVHEIEAFHWQKNEEKLKKNNITKQIFLKNNKAPMFGKKFSNIQLAETLSSIAKKGAKAFYEGEIARDMVKSLNNLGGLHTEEDFYKQNTIFSDTLISNYKDFRIHQCPPNGPGLVVHLMMKLLNKFNWNNINYFDPMRFHIQAEVSKVCFEIKETIFGDPQFYKIDIGYLMSNESIENLFKKINLDKVYSSNNLFVTSHPETVYLTVVDDNLNAVSFINSICHAFGSGICSENSGILFQNRGVNFRLEENHPNCIDSNKRPLHTIIPGLLTNKYDETVMSYGVMGGQYQPIGQAHVLQNIYDFNMNMQEAIDAPRAFALNGKLKVENSFLNNSVESLSELGHDVEIVDEGIGGGQGIMIDRKEGVLIGGSDPRKDGLAIGY